MKVIRFHFHGSRSFASQIVKWRTASSFSHVSIELGGYYYQSLMLQDFYRTIDPDTDILESLDVQVSDETYRKIEASLVSRLGTAYDYRSLIGWITNRYRQSRKKWFCSEMAMDVLTMIIGKGLIFEKLVAPDDVRIAVGYYLLGLDQKTK